MKNPTPTLIAAFFVIVMAVWWTASNAQVLGWRLTLLDLNRGTIQVVDVFQDEQDCLAARDYIQSGIRWGLRGTIILTCGPVRPA